MKTSREAKFSLEDKAGRSMSLVRFDDGSTLIASSPSVILGAQQVDDLIRFLRPDLLPLRFTVRKLAFDELWVVWDSTVDRIVSSFTTTHPDSEGAAKAEAARLNEGTQ